MKSQVAIPVVPKPASTQAVSLLELGPSWVAMAWLVSKLQWYWNHRPDLEFGWVVLLLSGYLLWEMWEKEPGARRRFTIANVVLLVTGCGLLLLTQAYMAAFGTMPAAIMGLAMGVMLVIAANLHFLFGPAGWAQPGLAFLFVLLAMPMPSIFQSLVISRLQSFVAGIDVTLLNLAGIPARQTGSLIELPQGTIGVSEACSGIRSIQSSVMATVFIGYLTLKRWSLRLVLVVVGLVIAIGGNVIRSFWLSWVANRRGVEAVEQVHDAAGWSILAFTVVGVGVVAFLVERMERRVERR